MELIWKDGEGNHVRAGDIHRIQYRMLDKARELGLGCVILAPMGTGKTETGLGYLLRLMAKYPTKRFGIISDGDDHAEDRLGAVRNYIEKPDPDFNRYFPNIKLDRSKRGRVTLSKFRLVQNQYSKDASLEAHGVLASGTGNRHDFQFYDDLCTEANSVAAPANRIRVKKAFFKTWKTRLVPKGGWWYYIGTLYHEDDLTHALMRNKRVASLKIGLSLDFKRYDVEEWWPGGPIDRNGKPIPKKYTIPLWEEGGWTEEKYREEYDLMASMGDTTGFNASYRNLIIDPETAAFRKEWFAFPKELIGNENVTSKKWIAKPLSTYTHRVIFADPAYARKKESCFYAGCVAGWDPVLEKMVVLYGWRAKDSLARRVDMYLDAVEEFSPHECCVEGKHEGSFAERLEDRAAERLIPLALKRINRDQTQEKVSRITGLGPLLQHKRLLVDLDQWPEYWSEAENFPNGKMDLLDATEGAVSRLRLWLKRRGYVPTRVHLSRQVPADANIRPHRYHFNRPPPNPGEERWEAERLFG